MQMDDHTSREQNKPYDQSDLGVAIRPRGDWNRWDDAID